jgi:hypothetical protein
VCVGAKGTRRGIVVVTGTERDGSADCLFAFEANTGTKLYGKRFCGRRVRVQYTWDHPVAFVEAASEGDDGRWQYRAAAYFVLRSGLELISSFSFTDEEHLLEYATANWTTIQNLYLYTRITEGLGKREL